MAARAGFEPATKWLTATCSATELPSNNMFQSIMMKLTVNPLRLLTFPKIKNAAISAP